jgi:sodium-dependent dicarboxylate transporter 2/3/5
MSASCAFMLPVATGPNTVVFSSGVVSTARMAREGFLINLMGVAVISSVCYVLFT